MQDLEEHNAADEVVILVFTEFGRRIKDNGSGTDHGSGGGAFIIGTRAVGGLYAEYPSLDPAEQLYGEDLKHTFDFRGVYATLLEQWLGLRPRRLSVVHTSSCGPSGTRRCAQEKFIMGKAYALLRAGFPYVKTLGMRRMTSNPIDLALGREGRLYIFCRGALATEIRRYNWDDEDLGTIGGPGTTDGKFLWPGAILADEEENLYVSDEGCHRISLFSRDGTFLGKWGEQGSGPGQLNRPSG